jgi:hypothetical protein
MPIEYQTLHHASFGDFMSYRSGATMPSGGPVASGAAFNVALIFERASDPTGLLESTWASRQQQLEALNDSGTLWTAYGANKANYDAAVAYLGRGEGNLGLVTLDESNSGYVSSAESRTIWVQLDARGFETLFGTQLRGNEETLYWDGSLALPKTLTDLGVKGLWFDTDKSQFSPVLPEHGKGELAELPQGWQSPGNAAGQGHAAADLYPNAIAYELQFPAVGCAVGQRADRRDRPHRAGCRHRLAGAQRQLHLAGRSVQGGAGHHHTGNRHRRRQGRADLPRG